VIKVEVEIYFLDKKKFGVELGLNLKFWGFSRELGPKKYRKQDCMRCTSTILNDKLSISQMVEGKMQLFLKFQNFMKVNK